MSRGRPIVGWMRAIEAGTTTDKKRAELLRQQQQSGLSVSAFCRNRGFSDQTFYNWRKRLGGSDPVRFALVAAGASTRAEDASIELILTSGDRLRIGAGADAETLRSVLRVLRERA
jgi:transposase-like protein